LRGSSGALGGLVAPYAAILRLEQARSLALGGIVGRFREGGTSLAIVLGVRATHGSFALSGVAAGAFLLCAAIGRPAQGRWTDRTGPSRALVAATTANALALAALAISVSLHAAGGWLVALSGLSGLTLPALSASLRALWPKVAPADVAGAYSLDTLLYEISLIISPALVGLLASLASPSLAIIALAVLGSVGAVIVANTTAARQAPHAEAKRGERTGLLTRTFLALLLITSCVGLAEGSLTVIVPAFASSHGLPATSGLLLSALAIGSLAGALAYGALIDRATWPRRLVGCAALLAVNFLLLASLARGIGLLALWLALAGIALSPTLTTVFIAIERATPTTALTEAFAWTSFAAPAGLAGGQALAGLLLAPAGLSTTLWLPAVAAAGVLAISVLTVKLAPSVTKT
jgi:MFS family permease